MLESHRLGAIMYDEVRCHAKQQLDGCVQSALARCTVET